MKTKKRWSAVAFGIVLIGLGLACFNYTKQSTLEHHQEWAREHNRPAPSRAIFLGGIGSGVVGVVVVVLSVWPRRGGS